MSEGTAVRVTAASRGLAVFNIGGTVHVIDDQCTHGPGSLSEGFIEGHVVECDFHGGRFDIVTGAVVAPPCLVPVRTYPTLIENGLIVVEVDDVDDV